MPTFGYIIIPMLSEADKYRRKHYHTKKGVVVEVSNNDSHCCLILQVTKKQTLCLKAFKDGMKSKMMKLEPNDIAKVWFMPYSTKSKNGNFYNTTLFLCDLKSEKASLQIRIDESYTDKGMTPNTEFK